MRVAELARLTGTTVRTVRHYHALGLLPVPPERGGWRDYGLSHVARLARIRWLAEAGVPLAAVAGVLDAEAGARAGTTAGTGTRRRDEGGQGAGDGAAADGGPAAAVVRDLEGALAAVEERMAAVSRQREMLSMLLDQARTGRTVSPMPPAMAAFYEHMEAAAADERTRAAVRRERDVAEVACYRGEMPPEALLLYLFPQAREDTERGGGGPDGPSTAHGTDSTDRAAAAAFGRDLTTADAREAERIAAQNIARIEEHLGPERLAAAARSVDPAAVRRAFRLMLEAEPALATVGAAMERHMLAAIETWRET